MKDEKSVASAARSAACGDMCSGILAVGKAAISESLSTFQNIR
jgi:hypothetical protein